MTTLIAIASHTALFLLGYLINKTRYKWKAEFYEEKARLSEKNSLFKSKRIAQYKAHINELLIKNKELQIFLSSATAEKQSLYNNFNLAQHEL